MAGLAHPVEQQLGDPAGQIEEDEVGILAGQPADVGTQRAQQLLGDDRPLADHLLDDGPVDDHDDRLVERLDGGRPRTGVGQRELADGVADLGDVHDVFTAVVGDHQHLEPALGDDDDRVSRIAFGEQDLAAPVAPQPGTARQPDEIFLVERAEQGRPAQQRDRIGAGPFGGRRTRRLTRPRGRAAAPSNARHRASTGPRPRHHPGTRPDAGIRRAAWQPRPSSNDQSGSATTAFCVRWSPASSASRSWPAATLSRMSRSVRIDGPWPSSSCTTAAPTRCADMRLAACRRL